MNTLKVFDWMPIDRFCPETAVSYLCFRVQRIVLFQRFPKRVTQLYLYWKSTITLSCRVGTDAQVPTIWIWE